MEFIRGNEYLDKMLANDALRVKVDAITSAMRQADKEFSEKDS